MWLKTEEVIVQKKNLLCEIWIEIYLYCEKYKFYIILIHDLIEILKNNEKIVKKILGIYLVFCFYGNYDE